MKQITHAIKSRGSGVHHLILNLVMSTIIKIFTGILILILYSCKSNENPTAISQILLPPNSTCDTMYVTNNELNEKMFFCIRMNKTNYLKIDSVGDTIEILRYINSALFERILFEKNKKVAKKLVVDFENLRYTLYDKTKKVNFYPIFKKSEEAFYFKLNFGKDEILSVDSLIVYNPSDYFPFYGYLNELDIAKKTFSEDEWIEIPKSVIEGDSIQTILFTYKPSIYKNGIKKGSQAQKIIYIDKYIYKWSLKL